MWFLQLPYKNNTGFFEKFVIDIRSVFDLIPIIFTIVIFVLITNQPVHNSQVDRPAFVAWMSMVMRMKNGNGFEIEYWPTKNYNVETYFKILLNLR